MAEFMKKAISMLLIVSFLATTLTCVFAAEIHDDDHLVHDYTAVEAGTALNDYVEVNYTGSEVFGNSVFTGSALKVAASDDTVWSPLGLKMAPEWCFSDYVGLQLYVKREGTPAGETDELYCFTLNDATGWDTFGIGEGKTVSYRAQGEQSWKRAAGDANENVWLPGNFEGYVEIPFASLTSHKSGNGGTLSLENLYALTILTNFSSTRTLSVNYMAAVTVLERTVADTDPKDPLEKGNDAYGDISITVLGDSISYGANAPDLAGQSYVGLLRKAVNATHDNHNYGFLTLQSSVSNAYGVYRERHTVSSTGLWSKEDSGKYLGFFAMTSTDASGVIRIEMPEASPYICVFYEEAPDNGSFDVAVNGEVKATVNSNADVRNPAARTDLIETGGENSLNIEIRKKDGSRTAVSGIGYYSDPTEVTVNNYSRSGAKLSDIDADVLNTACQANVLIFAMGTNDRNQQVDIDVFAQSIDRVIQIMNESGTSLIVNDFIWTGSVDEDAYKRELKRLAEACNGIYNDFNVTYTEQLQAGISITQDGTHPTVEGHRIVALQTAKALEQATGRTYTVPASTETPPSTSSTTSPEESEPSVAGKDLIINDFSGVSAGDSLEDTLVPTTTGPNVKIGSAFINDIQGRTGSTLKLAASKDTVWETAAIKLTPYWNFSDYVGIQFYMKRSGESESQTYHFYLTEAKDWETFHVKGGATVSYRAKGSDAWQKAICDDEGLVWLPANFEGTVEIPFSSLTYWYGGSGNQQLDRANLFDISILTDFSETQTICLDDLMAVTVLERSQSAPPTDSESSDPASAPDSTTSTAVPQKSTPLANYADKSSSDNAAEALQDDSQGKASYIPSIRGNAGSSLKLTGTKSNMDWVAFGLKLVSGWDATGMNAVELYIRKTPADKQSDNGAYRFAITEGGGTAQWETFRLKEKAKVLYMEKGGSTLKETEVLEDGICMLPSGFEGIVRLPLDQFVYWYGGTAGNDKQIQKDNLYSLTITTDVNADTQYLVVDEISAIENIRYIGSQSPNTGAAACAGAAVAALAGAAAVLFWTGRKRK